MRRYLIAGSDTGVGKTWAACRLLELCVGMGAKAAGFKPIACGDRSDAVALLSASGEKELTLNDLNPWFFHTPASPYTASVIEGRRADMAAIDAALQRLCERRDPVFIESAGGLMTPLSEIETMRDLAARWSCPVILIVPNRLGALSQSLANVECVLCAQLELAAIVLNDMPETEDPESPFDLESLRQTNFGILEQRFPEKVFRSDRDSLEILAKRLIQGS